MTDPTDDAPIPETADPGELTRALFEGHEGEIFTVRGGDHKTLELVLEEVEATRQTDRRPPGGGFHLTFSGPLEPHFQQGRFILTLPDKREVALFIVNNGPMDGRMRYQIILN